MYVAVGGAGATGEAAKALNVLLARASSAPPALLGQLVQLLADAAQAAARSRRPGGTSQEMHDADLRWLLLLVRSSLADASEATLRKRGRQAEAIERIMAAVAAVDARSEVAAAGDAACPAPAVGDSCWAEWPGDGRWYRARVCGRIAGTGGAEEVEVEWLPVPADVECGQDVQYLPPPPATLVGDGAVAPRRQRLTAVLPADRERPEPTATSEKGWERQLDTVETLCRAFRDLKRTAGELSGKGAESAEEAKAEKILAAAAASLAAFREQGEKEVAAAKSEPSAEAKDSAANESSEVEAALAERAAFFARLGEITREREELKIKLRALEDELADVKEGIAKAEKRERKARMGKKAAAGDDPAAERQQLLAEATSASRDVEALLAARAQEAIAVSAKNKQLQDSPSAVSKACLDAEKQRRRQLESLVAGFNAAIWGDGGPALAQDPQRSAAARTLLARAIGLVEQAWREAVQLAADSLGGDGGAIGADSEDMSRAASRYKQMRQDLHAAADRLGKLESQSQFGGFSPPSRGVGSPVRASNIDDLTALVGAAPAGATAKAASAPAASDGGAAY